MKTYGFPRKIIQKWWDMVGKLHYPQAPSQRCEANGRFAAFQLRLRTLQQLAPARWKIYGCGMLWNMDEKWWCSNGKIWWFSWCYSHPINFQLFFIYRWFTSEKWWFFMGFSNSHYQKDLESVPHAHEKNHRSHWVQSPFHPHSHLLNPTSRMHFFLKVSISDSNSFSSCA